jgi:hypothetical protein
MVYSTTDMSLKERLARYLRNNHGWIPKGEICDLAREKTGATGEHTGRRLRELAEEGVLDVQIRRGHAWYKLKDNVPSLF